MFTSRMYLAYIIWHLMLIHSLRVDEFYELLLEIGAEILEPPRSYDYAPGYYAVFFTDPDGIKLELVHIPSLMR